jgi:hypothetical protein
LPPDKFKKYNGKPTEEDAKNEVIQAMLPFKLEILKTDWWTCYRYAIILMTAPRTCGNRSKGELANRVMEKI